MCENHILGSSGSVLQKLFVLFLRRRWNKTFENGKESLIILQIKFLLGFMSRREKLLRHCIESKHFVGWTCRRGAFTSVKSKLYLGISCGSSLCTFFFMFRWTFVFIFIYFFWSFALVLCIRNLLNACLPICLFGARRYLKCQSIFMS